MVAKPWSKRPAKKVITKSGKKVYASVQAYEKLKQDRYRNPVAGFWAEHECRRDYGVFANAKTNSYIHNGEVRFQ